MLQDEIKKKSSEIFKESYQMSIGELANLYRDEEIDIHPEFQESASYGRKVQLYFWRIPQTGHCESSADACGGGSEGVWLQLCADYGLGYGSAVVHGFRVCKERKLYAV